MSRIRTIKPQLLSDEKTAALSHEGFRLFIGVVLLADDHGNLPGHPKWLETGVFWYQRPKQGIERVLAELVRAGFVATYEVRGQRYIAIRGWKKHQRVTHIGAPQYPLPSDPEAKPIDGNYSDSRNPHETFTRLSRNTPESFSPEKEKEKEKECASASEFDLEALYALYPRKRGRQKGLKALARLVKTPEDHERMRERILAFRAECEAKATPQQYIPHFSTWVNERRDLDEPELLPRCETPAPPADDLISRVMETERLREEEFAAAAAERVRREAEHRGGGA